MMAQRVLAVDPGREKCGVAAVDFKQGVLNHIVVETDCLMWVVAEWARTYECKVVIIGDGTSSTGANNVLAKLINEKKIDQIVSIDEYESTREARALYWQAHPPTGWQRIIPRGLLIPYCAIDDFAAIVLAERYFKKFKKE